MLFQSPTRDGTSGRDGTTNSTVGTNQGWRWTALANGGGNTTASANPGSVTNCGATQQAAVQAATLHGSVGQLAQSNAANQQIATQGINYAQVSEIWQNLDSKSMNPSWTLLVDLSWFSSNCRLLLWQIANCLFWPRTTFLRRNQLPARTGKTIFQLNSRQQLSQINLGNRIIVQTASTSGFSLAIRSSLNLTSRAAPDTEVEFV